MAELSIDKDRLNDLRAQAKNKIKEQHSWTKETRPFRPEEVADILTAIFPPVTRIQKYRDDLLNREKEIVTEMLENARVVDDKRTI